MDFSKEKFARLNQSVSRAHKIKSTSGGLLGFALLLLFVFEAPVSGFGVGVLGVALYAYYYFAHKTNFKNDVDQLKSTAERRAGQNRFADTVLSQLQKQNRFEGTILSPLEKWMFSGVLGLIFSNVDNRERIEHYWQALIAAELDESVNDILSILQENENKIDEQNRNVVNKLQGLYSDISVDANPEVIIEQLQDTYELAGKLYANILTGTVSVLNDEDWKELENRLEIIADIEATDVYDGEPERWDPSREHVNNLGSIRDRRDKLANGIERFDENAPEGREQRFRYGARIAHLQRIQNRIDKVEANLENGKLLRAQDELRTCRNDLDTLSNTVENDSFDNLQSQISATEDSLLELERKLQDTMTGTSQPGTTATNDTVDWTPDTGVEEPAELPDHEVIEEIGSGGNADVRKVELTDTGEVAALKIPRWQGTVSGDIISEFAEEAETWESIDDHDHIVSVYDSGTNPYPWMLLEYMAEGSLRDRLDNGTTIEDPSEILVNVCEAVSHAHRYGIAHNDLKPANFLFDAEDNIKVADWGLAKVLLDHSTSVEGLTPQYAAPEQVDPDNYGGTDDTTDVYQLGVIAYELLTGEPPYDRSNPAGTVNAILEADPMPPSERNPDLPTAVDDVVLQAMAPEKEDRYEHILYLRDELNELPLENIENELGSYRTQ